MDHESVNALESTARFDRNLPDFTAPAAHTDGAQIQPELDSRIEDYLDRIYAPMVGRLPYAHRQELRNEMRAHLGQLIAAHEELGSDSAEALTAALRQFGEPSTVASQWLEQLPAEQGITSRDLVGASRNGAFSVAAQRLAISAAAWVAIGVMFDRNISGPVSGGLYLSLGASLPFLTGYFIGNRYSIGRPVLSMLAAQAAVIPFWPFFMMCLESIFNHRQTDILTAAALGIGSFALLAPLGCLGAWVGKWQTHREARRRSIA